MTDRDFNYLKQYEDNLRTAGLRSGWARNPGRSALQGIYDIVHKTEQLPRFNPGCASCVLSILQKAGRLYFIEKAERKSKALNAPLKPAPDNSPKKPGRAGKSKSKA